MKKYLLLVIVIVVVIIFSLAYYFINNEINYLDNIGLNSFTNETINELLEKYQSEQEESYIVISCDGYDLVVEKGKTTYRFVRIEIYDNKYKFGRYKIGVGEKREQVEKAMKNKKKIKGLSGKKFGYIDDEIWVEFFVNDKDVVEKIKLYYGP